MFIRAYLRASTSEQNADRARSDLIQFAAARGLTIAAFYVENESGASLQRPELFRLLSDCQPGDVLLLEAVDRLTRLNADDWEKLKAEIAKHKVKIVALDLPTSWQMTRTIPDEDEFTRDLFKSLNTLILDILASVARKDYTDRRRRQAQGIAKAKADGRYKGRPEDAERNAAIVKMLTNGQSWSSIVAATGASRSTLSKLARRVPAAA
ncbi:recombinase family protein [Mesorhizobium sp. M0678]|uniref:recombinase family protein n=1 Tax=Mesorhizobium sp. M0678 TaxID=2956985 RepID=UPI00333ADB71